MNFKLKALVAAAVATITMSGAANAITVGVNGEMFLAAFDSTTNNSYIKALGTTALAFNGTGSYSANLASDTNWTSFAGAITNPANVVYQVLGFSAGTDSLIPNSFMRTTSSVTPNGPGLSNGGWDALYQDVSTSGGGLNTWMSNGPLGNLSVTGTGSRFIASLTTGASAGVLQNNWETQWLSGINTTAVLGANDGFYTVTRGAVVPRGQISTPVVSALLGNWNLNAAGSLTYNAVAAVPEADTSAMMLAGLGLMGFVARRRSKQA
jgi:hypothetical protein